MHILRQSFVPEARVKETDALSVVSALVAKKSPKRRTLRLRRRGIKAQIDLIPLA